MSFRDFAEESKQILIKSMDELGYPRRGDLEWTEPREKLFGDLSFRIAFAVGQTMRKSPAQLVAAIARYATTNFLAQAKYVKSIEGHPSGFLNFTINKDTFMGAVISSAQLESYGRLEIGKGKTVLVEHTSVNPNKALHVGHLRNVAIGDCMARLFSFVFYDTYALNYIDDSGLQIADIIVGMKYLGYSKEPPQGVKYDHYAGDKVYVEVTRKYETDSSLKEKQKLVLKGIETKDPQVYTLTSEVTEKVLRQQLVTCWRFGAFYDLLVYESDIIATKLWATIFEELKKRSIIRLEYVGKFKNCWIVSIKGEAEGEDKVLVRSDGTATYIAKDLPFAALKVGLASDRFSYSKYADQPNGKVLFRTGSQTGSEGAPVRWNADQSVTVIGREQSRLQRIILRILEQLAGKSLESRYLHLGYELVSLSPSTAGTLRVFEEPASVGDSEKAVRMAGRKGVYVNADDAMDAIKRRAIQETQKRNQDVTDGAWIENVAEKIAISAMRFALLKQDLDKMIVFDLEESLKLVGETGPYLLYTYARASSIISKLGDAELNVEPAAQLLTSESEYELVKMISRLDIAIEKSLKMLGPKWLAHYSFELCEAFNKFYEANRVLQEPDVGLRAARAALVKATMSVLKQALNLLGIEVLNKI
jgi:arginyl-tRNA synthetase